MTLSVLAINCTLKPSPDESSCGVLLDQVMAEYAQRDVTVETLRAVDFNIKPGTSSDEGEGDDWPQIRKKVLDANIQAVAAATGKVVRNTIHLAKLLQQSPYPGE